MKRLLLIGLVFIMVGCSNQTHLTGSLTNVETIFKDPHFADYQERSEELERLYLYKEINYAEYVERKREMDNDYEREVQARDAVILGNRNPSDL